MNHTTKEQKSIEVSNATDEEILLYQDPKLIEDKKITHNTTNR